MTKPLALMTQEDNLFWNFFIPKDGVIYYVTTIGLFANDVIIIGSVRADWPAPFNMTIGNPRADKLGRNGFDCIGRRC